MEGKIFFSPHLSDAVSLGSLLFYFPWLPLRASAVCVRLCVCAWCQSPRACPHTHCAKQVNATNSHQRGLWTVKPSMAGTGSSVPSPCQPLREQEKKLLHGNGLTLICFIFALHIALYATCYLGICVGFRFACWIVSSKCLQWQVFTACDSAARTKLFWDAFVLDLISVALWNPAL